MLMHYNKTFVAVLTLLGIVASLGWFATVQAGGGGARCGVTLVPMVIQPDGERYPPHITPGRGVIDVEISSDGDSFDVARVDPRTVRLGPDLAPPIRVAMNYFNGEESPIMQLSFLARGAGVQCRDHSVFLRGEFVPRHGRFSCPFMAIGRIRTVECHDQPGDQRD